MDLATESQATLKSCTASAKARPTTSAGSACWPGASSEAGVRFVEVGHGGWDQHRNLKTRLAAQLRADRQADRRPAHRSEAARPAQGHARHLGRRIRPHARQPQAPTAATTTPRASPCGWPAAACSGGLSYGATDDYGYEAVENKVHIHDLHATILHLLGLDHEKLTYRYAGRDFRLTDVYGNVVKEIFA